MPSKKQAGIHERKIKIELSPDNFPPFTATPLTKAEKIAMSNVRRARQIHLCAESIARESSSEMTRSLANGMMKECALLVQSIQRDAEPTAKEKGKR